MRTLYYLIAILIIPLMQSTPVFAHVKYSAEDKKIDLENSKKCKVKGDGYFKLNDTTACFTGVISEDKTYQKLKSDLSNEIITTLHFDSPGGDVLTAITLARALRKSGIKVVVHNYCFSSCANYILPAAHVLAIQRNTVIGMHGSLPRDAIFYSKTHPDVRKIDKSNPDYINKYLKIVDSYPGYYLELVTKENKFFTDMLITEQYITRYFELQRNSDVYDSGNCGIIPPITLIIGPEYFNQFYLGNLLEFDWDSETLVETEIFKFLAGKFSIVMDNELLPSRTPTIKKLDKTLCFQGL